MSTLTRPPARPPADADAWLRRYGNSTQPWLRLVCFPPAGCGASFFRDWLRLLPSDISLSALRYPGREDRIAEPCAERMEELAVAAAQVLEPLLDLPLALFGHSMGAYAAYETALLLERRGGRALKALFVSGQAVPGRRIVPKHSDDTDEELIGLMGKLGGSDDEALRSPELQELIVPPFRADCRLLEAYAPDPLRTLDTPIIAFAGEDDPLVHVDEVRAWSEVAAGPFDFRSFAGGHFYLAPQAPAVAREISLRLERHRNK